MEELLKLNTLYMEQNIELWEKIGMLEERIRGWRNAPAMAKAMRLARWCTCSLRFEKVNDRVEKPA